MADILFQRRKIAKGDTLSEIAEQVLGSAKAFQQILDINKGLDPKKLQIGQEINVPTAVGSAVEGPSMPGSDIGPVRMEPKAKATRSLDRPRQAPKVDPLTAGGAFVEGMMRRGWTIEEAAGAAGNAHVESGFRPGIKSSVPNEQSFGFLQWNGKRLRGLKNMAAQTGRDWQDPEVQMDWINMERNGDSVKFGGDNESRMYQKAFAGGGSPEEIAERFGQYVERPLKLADTVDIRRAAAAKYAYIDDITERMIGG
jgi:LysM repeat protein